MHSFPGYVNVFNEKNKRHNNIEQSFLNLAGPFLLKLRERRSMKLWRTEAC